MCTICISYLKHAAIFRTQVITNIDNLRVATGLSSKKVDVVCDTPEAITADQFDWNRINNRNERGTPQTRNINSDTYRHLKEELDLFFCDNANIYSDSDDDDRSNEDAGGAPTTAMTAAKGDTIKSAIHNFFNYTEKTFEEDDISNFDNITITIPDEYRERKCQSCKLRFMLNESYDTHLKECIQKKLIDFVNDSQQLLLIKKHKAISSAEFVRRMIFALKNIVKSLAMSNRNFVGTTTTSVSGSTALASAAIVTKPLITSTIVNNLLCSTTDKVMEKKIFKTIDQNVFCSPEHKFVGRQTLETVVAGNKQAAATQTMVMKRPNFVAKCPSCQQTFDSLQALEMHNRVRQNSESSDNCSELDRMDGVKPTKSSKCCGELRDTDGRNDSRQELLKLLNDVEYCSEGIVDVVKLRQKSPNPKSIILG